jgi:hypothetical protein
MSELKTLQETYEKCVNDYTKLFCDKQGFDLEFWCTDRPGSVGCFGDYFFDFNDIVFDVNTNQPKGQIIQWYDESVSNVLAGGCRINYLSYTKGIRY